MTTYQVATPESRIASDRLLRGYEAMVVGRAFDELATNLAKQGRLVVYPSSAGQEACQVGAVVNLRPTDWLFPTYRDTVAILTRGIDPVEALTLFHGSWHSGYDTGRWRTAPHATPLATQLPHAVGAAMAENAQGTDNIALALCGDGATSEGDFHEALNLAGVFRAPVVFLVQNNGYAISVPRTEQTAASSLALKGDGYGVPAVQVDGNDLSAVIDAVDTAVGVARNGGGPTLIEAITFRLGPHTNADDPDRYRDPSERARWLDRDPIKQLRARLVLAGHLDADAEVRIARTANDLVNECRARLTSLPAHGTSDDLFTHVFSQLTPHLDRQRTLLRGEVTA